MFKFSRSFAWAKGMLVVGIGLAVAVPLCTWAASETAPAAPADSLMEIVVTAQRREETLQKTSLALAVVSSEQLQNAGISQVRDLATVVPGLMIGMGGAATQIYIRGVGDFGSTPITNPAVAFNIDGIYIAKTQAVEGSLFDVARVEVLKGPQGTLYGRNASGGAINVIENRPSLDAFGGYGQIEVGNYNEVLTEGAINLPLNGQIALRGSFQDETRRGYTTENGDDDHHQSGRLQALWKTDAASALLVGEYIHLGGTGATYVPLGAARGNLSPWTSMSDPRVVPFFYAAAAAQGYCAPGGFFPGVVNPGACPALAPYPPPFPAGFTGPYTSVLSFPEGRAQQDNRFARIHAEISADLGWSTLTVLPAYQSANLDYVVFPGGLIYKNDPQDSKAKSLEVRLGNSNERLKWVGGLYFFEESQNATELAYGGLAQSNVYYTQFTTRSEAAFGELTYSVLDGTRLIAGARYTDDHKTIDGSVYSVPPSIAFLPPVPQNPCFAGLPNPCQLETYAGDRTYKKATWKVGVEQDLTPQNLLFATVSRGFKAGGFDQSAGLTVGSHDALSYDPETLTAYEVGSRNRFLDNRVQFNAEGFYWKYKDHQEPRLTEDGLGVISFDYENAGDATLYGLDLDLLAKATDADTVHGTVEYLHSVYNTFTYDVPPGAPPFARGAGNGYTTFDPISPVAANTGCNVSPITSGTLAGGAHVDCSGKELTHAPKWSGSLGLDHRFPLPASYSLTASAEAQFASKRNLAVDFLPSEVAPAYITENAYLNLNSSGDRWTVGLFCRNVSDRAVYTGAYQGVAAGTVGANITPPRTYGARLRVNF